MIQGHKQTHIYIHIYIYIYIFIFASSNKYKNIALVKFSTKFSGLTKKPLIKLQVSFITNDFLAPSA